jgi:hypothetical protein
MGHVRRVLLGAFLRAPAHPLPPSSRHHFVLLLLSSPLAQNGDFTLDYNAEATFFGALSSGRVAQLAAYGNIVYPWVVRSAQASAMAQQEADAANVTCPSSAAHLPCHLAPWGMQSFDQSVYMHWNLAYSLLPLINQFEYTLNGTADLFAALDGVNQWLACYLNKTTTADGGYVYRDNRALNPDAEHEGQIVPDPQIALALAARTLQAHKAMSEAYGVPFSPLLLDVLTHLAPFNTVPFNVTPPGDDTFEIYNDTRCSNDSGFIPGSTLAECEASCAARATCDLFTFCPSRSVPGCDVGPSCWQYSAAENSTCHSGPGFTSGLKVGGPPGPAQEVDVLTAFAGAGIGQSDSFALYPIWPSEQLSSMPGAGGDAPTSVSSAVSSTVYIDWGSGRTVDVFATAVLAGWFAPTNTSVVAATQGNQSPPLLSSPASFSPADVLDGLETQVAQLFGPNLLLYAPGGGIENIGVARAINDMLVGAVGGGWDPARLSFGILTLFPFWPAAEPASFTGLLVKGGLRVSAAWDNITRSVVEPATVTAVYAYPIAPTTTNVWLRDPWGAGAVAVTCGGVVAPVTWPSPGVAVWTAPVGVDCAVTGKGKGSHHSPLDT